MLQPNGRRRRVAFSSPADRGERHPAGGSPGSSLPRSDARPTRREPHGANPRARSRALFSAVRDDPAPAHERGVRLDRGRHGEGGRRAHPARGHPRPRRQPEQDLKGAVDEPPGATVCPRAQGRG